MVASEDEGDIELFIEKIAKQVRQELKSFPANRNNYQCRINEAIAKDYASDTLLLFFRTLLPNIKDKQLPILMMCNMITGLYTKMPTPLQVALATVIKEKERIQELNQFGVLCTYDEVLRFRRSAAHASKRLTNRGLTPSARLRSVGGCGKVKLVERILFLRQSFSHFPQQMNPFCSMQSDLTFRRAFGDTQMSLSLRR